MNKQNFNHYICAPFCSFYKEDEKEEMACQCALVVEELIEKDRLNPETLPKSGKHPGLWQNHDSEIELICEICPFRMKDCDYQSENPPLECEPCGGYILLSLLKTNNDISMEDIKEIVLEH